MGFHQLRVARGLVGRQVKDEESIGASFRGIGVEAVITVDVNGVQVGEEDDRNLRGFADFANRFEDSGDGGSCCDGATGGGLDRGSVGEGIGERNA